MLMNFCYFMINNTYVRLNRFMQFVQLYFCVHEVRLLNLGLGNHYLGLDFLVAFFISSRLGYYFSQVSTTFFHILSNSLFISHSTIWHSLDTDSVKHKPQNSSLYGVVIERVSTLSVSDRSIQCSSCLIRPKRYRLPAESTIPQPNEF